MAITKSLSNYATLSQIANKADLDSATGLVRTNQLPPVTQEQQRGSFLEFGGAVSYLSTAYDFRVSPATYTIQGTRYTSAQTDVSLGASNASFDRFDCIIVDTTGTVSVVAGTAAANPSTPDIDPLTQLILSTILVAANSAVPAITNTPIYRENADWTSSVNGNIVANSSTDPFAGSLCVAGTSAAAGAYVRFTKSGTISLNDQKQLVFMLKPTSTWPSSKSLRITWYSGGVKIGQSVAVSNNRYGFLTAQQTYYQQIIVPIADFAVPASQVVDRLEFYVLGSSSAISFRLDNVALEPNSTIINPTVTTLEGSQITGPYTTAGMTMNSGYVLGRESANSGPVEELAISSLSGYLYNTRTAKTSAFSVGTSDQGVLFDCTSGTFTASLAAAATLGSAFSCAIINTGQGIITIDPNGSEVISDEDGTGGTTVTIFPNESGVIFCTGTAFRFLRTQRQTTQPAKEGGRVWRINTETTVNGYGFIASAFGNGIFVAVVNNVNDIYATSIDGIFWTVRSFPVITASTTYTDVKFANGQFIAVAAAGTNANFRVSTDGINWTPSYTTTPGSNVMIKVAWCDGSWLAMGANTSSQQFRSYDGYTWFLEASSLNTDSVYSVCYGKGQVHVATGYTSKHFVSTNKGSTFSAGTLPSATYWRNILYENGIFMAFGMISGVNVCYTSPDGTTWTQRTIPTSNIEEIKQVAYGDGVWIATTDGWSLSDSFWMRSIDNGVTWTVIKDYPVQGRFNANHRGAVCYGDGVWIMLPGNATGTQYTWTSGARRSVKETLNSARELATPIGSFRLPVTAAFTVTAGHRGAHFDVTSGTFTITLTAAATLRNGFAFSVANSGSGVVTIDPNSTETIRDSSSSDTTKTLSQGESGIVICDGTGWFLMKVAAGGSTFNPLESQVFN